MPTHSLYLTTNIPTKVPEIPNISCVGDDNSIIVTFSPNGDGGSVITSYEYSTDNFIADINSIGANSSPYTITGLEDGTTYNIEIRAVNKNGYGEKTISPDITPIALPSAPSISSITTASNQVTITYSAPNDIGGSIIEYYVLTYSSNNFVDFITVSPVSTNPITIYSLTNGLTYKFKIQAKNGKGIGAESEPFEIPLPSPSDIITSDIINQYTTSVWLDTTTPASNFILSGSNVTSWLDKTSNGYNLSNVGTITYNSTSPTSVTIPANSQFKQTATPYFNMTTTQQTWFYLFSIPTQLTGTDYISLLSLYNSTQAGGYNTTIRNNSKLTIDAHGTNNGIGFNMTTIANTKYLITISLNTSTSFANANTNSIMRLNGITQTGFVSGTGAYSMSGTSSLAIGGGYFTSAYYSSKDFNIYEIIGINNQALNINDIRSIEEYLNTKWNFRLCY